MILFCADIFLRCVVLIFQPFTFTLVNCGSNPMMCKIVAYRSLSGSFCGWWFTLSLLGWNDFGKISCCNSKCHCNISFVFHSSILCFLCTELVFHLLAFISIKIMSLLPKESSLPSHMMQLLGKVITTEYNFCGLWEAKF